MDAEIKNIIEHQYKYIRHSIFKSSPEFMKNVMVMKFNTNLEWYNCSLIASQSSNPDSVVVNTTEGWEYILEIGNDGIELIDENKKPVVLLNPNYNFEYEYIQFDLLDTYYLSDYVLPKGLRYKRISSIEKIISKYDNYEKLMRILKNGWQEIFLTNYLKMFDFYYTSSEEIKDFYLLILSYAFGEELRIVDKKSFFIIDDTKYDMIIVYRNLHQLISSFHIAFKIYLDSLSKVYREIEILNIDKEIQVSTAYERMVQLKEGRSNI